MSLHDDERKRVIADVAREMGISEEEAMAQFIAMAERAAKFPPGHPDAPKYWMDETSGELSKAVKKYLDGGTLALSELWLIKAYLWQWLKSPAWRASGSLEALRLRVAAINDQADLRAAISAAIQLGMDPL